MSKAGHETVFLLNISAEQLLGAASSIFSQQRKTISCSFCRPDDGQFPTNEVPPPPADWAAKTHAKTVAWLAAQVARCSHPLLSLSQDSSINIRTIKIYQKRKEEKCFYRFLLATSEASTPARGSGCVCESFNILDCGAPTGRTDFRYKYL